MLEINNEGELDLCLLPQQAKAIRRKQADETNCKETSW